MIIKRDFEGKEELDEFLYSLLRHDLRNKAQIARGYLELMKDFELPEKALKFVEKADKSIRDEIDMIEKVRSIREVIHKDVELEDINLKNPLNEAIKDQNSKASEKGFEINFNGDDFQVRGGNLLVELFSNLIENAIEHSRGDKVRISTVESDDEIQCIIEDDGKGIPDEAKKKVFRAGYKKGETAGSGLGLFLASEIVEAYGGDIEIADSELDGARVDVYLQKPN